MELLGKYRIIEQIGEGAYAVVFRALDSQLEREVALKILHPALMADQTFVNQFHREARIAARLQHSNIVPIFDIAQEETRLFLAMALINGPSLAVYIQEKESLSWDEAKSILSPVCAALQHAHSQNVLHRDLKPGNILLHTKRTPLITDFGLSKVIGNNSLSLRISGGIIGTPAYIAPEIWEGEDASAQSEVYALACIVYEMLTGRQLFTGNGPVQIMRSHDRGAQLETNWTQDVPEKLRDVLAKALEKDPGGRFSSAQDFLDAVMDLDVSIISLGSLKDAQVSTIESNDEEYGIYDYLVEAEETVYGLNDWLVDLAEQTRQVSEEINAKTAEYQSLRGQMERGSSSKTRAAVSNIASTYMRYAKFLSEKYPELRQLWEDLETNSIKLFKATQINSEDDLNAAFRYIEQVNQTRNSFNELRASMKTAREQTSKMRGVSKDLNRAVGQVANILDRIIEEFSEGDARLERTLEVVKAKVSPPNSIEP